MAIKEGFSSAAVVDTADIVFDVSFRSYCEENLCGQYGANHSCPPSCGTPEDMKQKILRHNRALVLQTIWNIFNFQDKSSIDAVKRNHRDYAFSLIEKLEQKGCHGLMVGASFCSLCTPCAITDGTPCLFPRRQYSCMSAYCIYVKDLADKCGMNYTYKDGVLPLFSMYIFDWNNRISGMTYTCKNGIL